MISPAIPSLPICPYCHEPGLHMNSAACIAYLQGEIFKLRPTRDRTRDVPQRSPQFLRRDRADLPPFDLPSKP